MYDAEVEKKTSSLLQVTEKEEIIYGDKHPARGPLSSSVTWKR